MAKSSIGWSTSRISSTTSKEAGTVRKSAAQRSARTNESTKWTLDNLK